MTDEQVAELQKLARQASGRPRCANPWDQCHLTHAITQQAAKYFPDVEIIEINADKD